MADISGESDKPKNKTGALGDAQRDIDDREIEDKGSKRDPLDEARLPNPPMPNVVDSYWRNQAGMSYRNDAEHYRLEMEQADREANREIDRKNCEGERKVMRMERFLEMLDSAMPMEAAIQIGKVRNVLNTLPSGSDVPTQIIAAAVKGEPNSKWTQKENEQYEMAKSAFGVVKITDARAYRSFWEKNYPRCPVDGEVIYPYSYRYQPPRTSGSLGRTPYGTYGYPYSIVPYKANPLADLKKSENIEK